MTPRQLEIANGKLEMNKGLPISAEELAGAQAYLRASLAAGRTRIQRSAPAVHPVRKNWTYSMTPKAIRQRKARGVVIPEDGRRGMQNEEG